MIGILFQLQQPATGTDSFKTVKKTDTSLAIKSSQSNFSHSWLHPEQSPLRFLAAITPIAESISESKNQTELIQRARTVACRLSLPTVKKADTFSQMVG